jgi:hypothetical protein
MSQEKGSHPSSGAVAAEAMLTLGYDHYTSQTAYPDPAALQGNVQIIGQTQLGKTVLMQSLAIQLMRLGWSLCYIDPLGTSIDLLLDSIPRSYLDKQDVIFLSPFDEQVVPWNPLEGGVSGETVHLFESLLEESFMSRSQDLLSMSILALQTVPHATFEHIARVVNDDEYRRKVINPRLTDPEVKRFWEVEYESWIKERYRPQAVAALNNKMRVFSTSHPLRDMLCAKGTFQVHDLFDGKILLCDVSRARLGKVETILSAMILSKLTWAAMNSKKPYVVFYDNANFANENILHAAAESNLGLVFAHQSSTQITAPPTAHKFVFQVGIDDARKFEGIFPYYAYRYLTDQKPYSCYAKVGQQVLHLEPLAPFTTIYGTKTQIRVRQQSREHYARSRDAVHTYLKHLGVG